MISIEFIGGLPSQISLNAEEAPRAPTKCQLDGYIDYLYLPDDLFTVCLSLSALFGKAQLANNNESETGLLRLMRMCPNDPAVAGLIQTRVCKYADILQGWLKDGLPAAVEEPVSEFKQVFFRFLRLFVALTSRSSALHCRGFGRDEDRRR